MGQPAFIFGSYSALAAVTASSSKSGFVGNDILGATEDIGHTPAASGDVSYLIDCATARTCDCFAILGEAFDGLAWEVEGSDNGSDFTSLGTGTLSLDLNCAWDSFTSASHRYWRLTLTAAPSNLLVNHICLDTLAAWPYLEEDWDESGLVVEGEYQVSAAGYFAGGTAQKAERKLTIAPGVVTAAEFTTLQAFAAEVIRPMAGAFFVPDVAASAVYFGFIEGKSFAAPFKNGAHEVQAMTFVTRAA